MKFLLVGGYGKLGSAFPASVKRLPKNMKDICLIEEKIRRYKPEFVINCAGITGTYVCTDSSTVFDYNTALPIHLAKICRDIGSQLIQFSTFYIGEGLYLHSKRMMEEALTEMSDTTVIFLPTLVDKDMKIAHYPENFHVAYTKDVADWVMEHPYTVDQFLCNEGIPTRQEFVEYTGRKFDAVLRRFNAVEEWEEATLTEMRPWRDAIDETRIF